MLISEYYMPVMFICIQKEEVIKIKDKGEYLFKTILLKVCIM